MKFFRTMLASMLGFILAFVLLFLVVLISVLSSQRETEPYIRDGSVLKINLQGPLPERATEDPFEMLFMDQEKKPVNMRSLHNNLRKAAADDRIAGIKLNVNFMGTSWSQLEEAREMLNEFRDESDKFIYAATDDAGWNEQGYYLASVADSIFAPPETFFQFKGFRSNIEFYGGMLEKIGVEIDEVTSGPFKSPGVFSKREELDPENREQIEAIIAGVNNRFTGAVAEKSGMSASEVDDLLNERPRMRMSFAKDYGLIDDFMYPDQIEERILNRSEEAGNRRPEMVSLARYNRVTASSAGVDQYTGSEKIAVIYAGGPILPQTSEGIFPGDQNVITATRVLEQIEDIEDDDDVKAVVVRINSPGGSPDTSDLIWERLKRLSEDIPVVASMGPVAASGGYYIAAGADTIVASPNTITGSIGVIGTLFNYQDLYDEHLNISVDKVKSHDWADWMDPDRRMTDQEKAFFEDLVDDLYDTFLDRMAESRDMSRDEIHEVAQGRIWTGDDALDRGLVDAVGGLRSSIDIAGEMAELEDWNIEVFPKPKTFLERLSISTQMRLEQMFNPDFPGMEKLRALEQLEVFSRPGGLYMLPYEIEVK